MNSDTKRRLNETATFCAILALFLTFQGQVRANPANNQNGPGSPTIKNYTPKDYDEENQIWSIAQDKRGVMYFGGGYHVMEFDGQRFRKIPVISAPVRSMATADDGTIYVGTSGEFGFLAADETGELQYKSIKNKIPEKHVEFGDIWSISPTSHGVYFASRHKIFRLIDDKIEVIVNVTRSVFIVNDRLYIQGPHKQISVLKDGKLIHLRCFDIENDEGKTWLLGRFDVLPWHNGKALIISTDGGLLVHDTERFLHEAPSDTDGCNTIEKMPTEIDAYLLEHEAREAFWVDASRLVVATSTGGVVIIDDKGHLLEVINRNRGLLSDIVLEILLDSFGNLWAGTDKGISHVSISSPLRIFDSRADIKSSVLSIEKHKSTLYIGTFAGLYYLPPYKLNVNEDKYVATQVDAAPFNVFAFAKTHGALLAATGNLIYEVIGGEVRELFTTDATILSIQKSKRFDNILFVGTNGRFLALKITKDIPRKTVRGHIPSNTEPVISLDLLEHEALDKIKGGFYFTSEDELGDLWISPRSNGLYRISWQSDDFNDLKVTHFGVKDGLPNMEELIPQFIRNRLLVSTYKGIYVVDEKSRMAGGRLRFVPEMTFGRRFHENEIRVQKIFLDRKERLWVQSDEGFGILEKKEDGSYGMHAGALQGTHGEFSNMITDEKNALWLGTPNGLYYFDPTDRKDYKQPFNALIRSVTLGEDKVIFHGTNVNLSKKTGEVYSGVSFKQTIEPSPIPYASNGLVFDFAAPFFESPDLTVFQYRLNGFDRDWSGWSPANTKEYTNLPEGRYRFEVRAKNMHEHESTIANYAFTILAPWYRTVWAYIGYGFAFLLIFFGAMRVVMWRLFVAKTKLKKIIKKRTAEVVAQNHALQEQKEEIAAQRDQIELTNEALWGEMELAKKIQTVLLPDEPTISGFDISAYMEPADEVGGDYYDVININGADWIIIGDVSGHGVPSGLVMMMVQTSIRTALQKHSGDSPSDILETVNRVIYENIHKMNESKYMTITIFSCFQDGVFYFSGLHQDILIYRAHQGEVEQIETNGMWIGTMDEVGEVMDTDELKMNDEDVMLLYTDGITEAADDTGKMFSIESLRRVFKENGSAPVKTIQTAILDAIKGLNCNDDITLMVIKKNAK